MPFSAVALPEDLMPVRTVEDLAGRVWQKPACQVGRSGHCVIAS
ncbi:hypothetical protein SBD_2361 [Streptomyces bottropensis ATCC 25435]|uniref:Uncharacterized protein n=1 Tax=Streptomyces bottropensis ATCC 25435 TaxID=1054862 RepID=M3F0K8_9ACTN|nr:hypothetical protein SBD_2361 [Streptomyces bottropensis ATCC 25435]